MRNIFLLGFSVSLRGEKVGQNVLAVCLRLFAFQVLKLAVPHMDDAGHGSPSPDIWACWMKMMMKKMMMMMMMMMMMVMIVVVVMAVTLVVVSMSDAISCQTA